MIYSFSGCKSKDNLTVLRVGGGIDSGYKSETMGEFELWLPENINPHLDETADKKFSVNFNGKTYSGDYKSSKVELMTNYRCDRYMMTDGYFEINAETNELFSIHIFNPKSTEKKVALKDGEILAQKIAAKYIDVNNYKLVYPYLTKLLNTI